MVRDAYANYVVQTTLDVISDGPEKVQLLQELNDHADQLVSLPNAILHNLGTFAQKFLVYNIEELHFRETYCDEIEHTMSSKYNYFKFYADMYHLVYHAVPCF